jgi:hypothetical protein
MKPAIFCKLFHDVLIDLVYGRHVTTPSMMGMGNESPASPEVVESETIISPMNLLDSLKENQNHVSETTNSPPGRDATLVFVNGKFRVEGCF